MHGNTYYIAAQFSHIRNPDQTSICVKNFGDKDFEKNRHRNKHLLQVSLPVVPTMAQRKRSSSMPPAVASQLPPHQSQLQPRSGEQMNHGRRRLSKQPHHPKSPPSTLPTATHPLESRNCQDSPPRMTGGIEENRGAQNLRRSTSRSRRQSESMKPGTDTKRDPGIPGPYSKKADIKAPPGNHIKQGQIRLGQEFERASFPDAVQLGSHQGVSRPRSLNIDFSSEGSSIAVPDAQTCVYIIKQGRSHAIPYRLEPGLRDSVSRVLRLRQSQQAVYKKLASLSPENIAALQAVLDDGGPGPQTRRLVQLNILQKSQFQTGGSKEPAVMAIVEDSYPQRPWREDPKSTQESGDNFVGAPTDPRVLSYGDRHQPMHKEMGPQFRVNTGYSGRRSLDRHRPHRDVQDVSRDMMTRDEYHAALTTYRVWIIQQHPSLKQPRSETESWAKCTVIEDFRSHDDITQRLLVLDNKSPSVNMKRLSLRPDQQTQIARLHETVVNDEASSEYQWNLRQLDLIRSKSKPFRLVSTITAVFVYLARTPRAHVDLQHLFEMQQVPEDDDSQEYSSILSHCAQPISALQPPPDFDNHSHYGGPPKSKHHPQFPNGPLRPPPPNFHPPRPPLPPDAPYNPYGPPDGYPPPQTSFAKYVFRRDRGRSPSPPRHEVFRSSEQRTFTDEPSDSDWSSAYLGDDHASKKNPGEGKTRLPARLVSKRALLALGYPWVEEAGCHENNQVRYKLG